MALVPVDIYRLMSEQLRDVCVRQGLNSSGSVRELRRRLVKQRKVEEMANKQEDQSVRASASLDLPTGINTRDNTGREVDVHASGRESNAVLVDLMRQVAPLTSNEPEAILRFIAHLDEVHELELCDDRVFITHILPLVPGVVMRFFGECLKERRNWKQCKTEIMHEFCPPFIRERLIRDLITFNFHKQHTPVREYIDQVFSAARILEYNAQEQELVDRIVMNLHPDILAHSAFLDRPQCRKDLYDTVALIEEKIAVNRERQRGLSEQISGTERRPYGGTVNRNATRRPQGSKCWTCGQTGHIQRYCRANTSRSGNGQEPGGRPTPGQEQ